MSPCEVRTGQCVPCPDQWDRVAQRAEKAAEDVQLNQVLTGLALAGAVQETGGVQRYDFPPRDQEKVKCMVRTRKKKPARRDERHSAAWGKRLSVLVLLLVTEVAFAQGWNPPFDGNGINKRLSPELTRLASRPGRASSIQTVKVIVQYRQTPGRTHFSRMQNVGGRLHTKLH